MVYEGDIDLIKDINDMRVNFKNKNVVIGICESIVNNTHFIKFFSDDENNFNEKFINAFYLNIANILYNVVIYEFYNKEMYSFLIDTYFFLKNDEIQDVEIASMKILKNDSKIEDENSIYCLNRKNVILDKIVKCIKENNEINIQGFITFRMKELMGDLEAIIDKVVEKYMVEKEYNEFIKLLKYFVDVQESKIEEINIIINEHGKYLITDKYMNNIMDIFLKEISDDKLDENYNIEDLIISGLITSCPQKVKIYGTKYCKNKEILDTIKNVFLDKAEFHEGCISGVKNTEKIFY
jgi:putative sporulation protein YtxC